MSLKNNQTLKNIPLKKVTFLVPSESSRHHTRIRYEKDIRKNFLQHLAKNHRNKLIEVGLWDNLIDRTLAKGKTPPGWGIHHKIPLHGGGTNDFDNLIFIKFIDHFQIHRYIDNITGEMHEGQSLELEIPFPENEIFSVENHSITTIEKAHKETEEERRIRIQKNKKKNKQEFLDRIKH